MSEKVTNLIEEVKALTVLELSELVKALEEEFGVSAAAPAAVAVAAPAAAAPVEEEKTEFDVILRLSRKLHPRMRLRLSRLSWWRLAQKWN